MIARLPAFDSSRLHRGAKIVLLRAALSDPEKPPVLAMVTARFASRGAILRVVGCAILLISVPQHCYQREDAFMAGSFFQKGSSGDPWRLPTVTPFVVILLLALVIPQAA